MVSVELILREDPTDEDDQIDGPGHGKHYLLRDLKTGKETDFGKLAGFTASSDCFTTIRIRISIFSSKGRCDWLFSTYI